MTSPEPQRPLRIAHAYGNHRDKLEAALAADIDLVEADIWHRAGDIWVRHEHRLAFAPLLYDRRPHGVDGVGPWTLPLFARYYFRLDVQPLRLSEVLERARGKMRLLLDLKNETNGDGARACAPTLVRLLDESGWSDSVIVCGQTDVLDDVREAGPHLDVRYSIERPRQWQALLRRLDGTPDMRGVCMDRRFFDRPVRRVLREAGLQVFCWTVDDPAEARRLVSRGAHGIISNSLPMLESLTAPNRKAAGAAKSGGPRSP